jgi:hypothetical protein
MPGSPPPDLVELLRAGPFHDAFRAAVRARGLSLDRLRARLVRRELSVALSSLSDWQHGRRRPAGERSRTVVRALEEILGVPVGALVRLLDEPSALQSTLDDDRGPLAELLDQLPGSRAVHAFDVLSGHDKVVIDARRRTASIWSRTAVRARTAGVDRYLVRYFGDAGCDIERVHVQALENCRLGRVMRHPAGVLVAELLFDETLEAGQTWVFEDVVSDGTGAPSTEFGTYGDRMPARGSARAAAGRPGYRARSGAADRERQHAALAADHVGPRHPLG